jgi:hypothetical protein
LLRPAPLPSASSCLSSSHHLWRFPDSTHQAWHDLTISQDGVGRGRTLHGSSVFEGGRHSSDHAVRATLGRQGRPRRPVSTFDIPGRRDWHSVWSMPRSPPTVSIPQRRIPCLHLLGNPRARSREKTHRRGRRGRRGRSDSSLTADRADPNNGGFRARHLFRSTSGPGDPRHSGTVTSRPIGTCRVRNVPERHPSDVASFARSATGHSTGSAPHPGSSVFEGGRRSGDAGTPGAA